MPLPKHIVVIPDGNRRWARHRGKPAQFGHFEGAKSAERILKAALDMGILNFTFWGCSVSNVTERSKTEIAFLFLIFERYFKKLLKAKELEEHDIRVRALGRFREIFPKRTQKPILELIEKTKHNKGKNLTFLLAYDGRDEMVEAIENIKRRKKGKIDRTVVKENLWTKDLPPVDLVIRTGGEPHWSAGLMMWDVAEARLHFTETLWPAFSPEEFRKIVTAAGKAERRYGR